MKYIEVTKKELLLLLDIDYIQEAVKNDIIEVFQDADRYVIQVKDAKAILNSAPWVLNSETEKEFIKQVTSV